MYFMKLHSVRITLCTLRVGFVVGYGGRETKETQGVFFSKCDRLADGRTWPFYRPSNALDGGARVR